MKLIKNTKAIQKLTGEEYVIWDGAVELFLDSLPVIPQFDLVVTSPPYNIGKAYEVKTGLDKYLAWQENIITKVVPLLKDTGSLCWQIGNYMDNGQIMPLDIELTPIFRKLGLQLRNRIVWHFGHGLHNRRRFSGRYEVILWFTKSDNYIFNLDAVRIPPKYPGKRHFKGPNKGKISSNPLGKNPEDVWNGIMNDVWDIPNVKSNHIEKTIHPCQFPVGLIERLILALTTQNALVFDPFAGVGSAGVASALHNRYFWGAELSKDYNNIAKGRIEAALNGTAKYRPHDKPIYDHKKSKLSLPVNFIHKK